MSIKRTIITTVAVLAMVAVVAPAVTSADTISDLLAQIQALQAQLLALQGGTGTGGTGACAGITFNRNMTVGATGSDVKCLQVTLNANGYTVATTGAGSPGMETSYFGPKTLAAVRIFQAAKGFTPANQVGPLTRAALNAILGGTGGVNPPPVIPTGAGLSVQLASDNPAAGTVVDGQALYPYLKLIFVNGDNAEATVTGLKLKRIGVSADDTVDNVYLFNGATRLTDGAAVSSTVVNFNDSTGLFKVPAGGSVTITVVGDTDGTAGETAGFQLVSATDVTSNASSVKGGYPLTGNLMSLATGTLASVVISDTTTPSAATIDPQSDYPVFQNSAVVYVRAADLKRIAFRKTGSVANSDLQNLRLYIDGVQVGNAVQNLDSNGYVTFDLSSSPKRLETGTRVIKVLADIIGGSGLNFTINLWNAADVTVVDSQYGANILIEKDADGTAFTKEAAGEQTVGSGVLSITKMSDSPSGNIINGASNAVLAKFQIKATGERVKIESLKISARVNTGAVSGLRNGMLLANGVQIGSTSTLYDPDEATYDYTTFNLGSSLIVVPGSPVTLEVRGDVYDSDSSNGIVADSSTIQIAIEGSSDENNALGMTSASTIDAPSSDVTGNSLSVTAGTLTLSRYEAYTARTVVVPVTNIKLGHFTLTSSATEATNINTIYVDLTTNNTVVENLYVKYGANTTSVKANPSEDEDGNSWSINYTLPAGQTVDMEVWGDVNSLAKTTMYTQMRVSGTTASSGTSVNSNGSTTEVDGQTITFGTGTAVALIDGSTPAADAVAGNQEVTAAKFKFTASNDSYTITEAKININDNDNGGAVVQYLTLTDGTNTYTQVYDAQNNYFNLTGLNIPVPANTTKVLTAKLMLATPATNGTTITTGRNVALELNYIKALNSQGEVKYGYEEDDDGTDTGVTMTEGAMTGNALYVYKSVPTFAVGTISSQSANLKNGSAGTQLYSFAITASAKGPVALKQLKLPITISDPDTTAVAGLTYFKFFRGATDLTSDSLTIQTTAGASLEGTTSLQDSGTVVVTFTNEEVIEAGATQTYYLKATPTGFGWHTTNGADSVSTYLVTDTDDSQDGSQYYLDSTSSVFQLESSAANDDEAFNIIWSDMSANGTDANTSAVGHDYTDGASSADWFTGYKVLKTDLDSISTTCTQ